MPKLSKNITTVLIIVAAVSVILGVKLIVQVIKPEPGTGKLVKVKGHNNAPMQVVEFIDFQCPACAVGAKYLKEYIEANPEKIRLEMKYFPLSMHKHAFLSAQYAECAARQNQFWPMHDLLIDRQSEWSKLLEAKAYFDQLSQEIHLNPKQLEKCLNDTSVGEEILKHKQEGQMLGVKSTPSYFVNGKMVVGQKSLETEIQNLTNAKQN